MNVAFDELERLPTSNDFSSSSRKPFSFIDTQDPCSTQAAIAASQGREQTSKLKALVSKVEC